MAPVADNGIWAGLATVFLPSTVNRLAVYALFLHRKAVCGHKTHVFSALKSKKTENKYYACCVEPFVLLHFMAPVSKKLNFGSSQNSIFAIYGE
jgi:hypothetical protein